MRSPSPLRLAAVSLACLALGACATSSRSTGDVTGSLASPVASRSQLADLGKRYESNPGDAGTAIAYGAALRGAGQRAQAVAVLEQAAIRNPKDMAVLGAYGRALAETGQLPQALDVLSRAHSPDKPDWRILNVQGAVLDQMGRNEEAQRYYETALKIAPGEPAILSNLGLSYALSKNLPRAEATLRQAAASPKADARMRQNLALVLSLQGRIGEAETLARADLPPSEAQASIDNMRRMASAGTGGKVASVPGSASATAAASAARSATPSTAAQSGAPMPLGGRVAALPAGQ